MPEFFHPIYILRGADFGQDFASKLWLSIAAVALVLWDWRSRKRLDYAWVFLTGTLIWTLAETALQVTGARVMPVRELYGVMLPLSVSALLQGMAEGAFVAVFSLFAGDRLQNKRIRTIMLVLFFTASAVLLFGAVFHADGMLPFAGPPSQRNILAPRALVFLACMTLFNIIFWFKYKTQRKRTLAMAASMLMLVTLWTLQQVYAGGRWVEIFDTASGAYVRAPFFTSLLVMSFDVFFEMIMAYIPFLALPVMLGGIKAESNPL